MHPLSDIEVGRITQGFRKSQPVSLEATPNLRRNGVARLATMGCDSTTPSEPVSRATLGRLIH